MHVNGGSAQLSNSVMTIDNVEMNLENKTILFLGSSVTYGSAAGGVSFVDMIGELC